MTLLHHNCLIQAIVTDIEGTTTDIDFVHKVLFPYASKELPLFVRQHHLHPDVVRALQAVREEAGMTPHADVEDCITVLQAWAEADRKISPLKAIQGMIWQEGYARGIFTAHIYEDVLPALRHWHAADVDLYVYSSGSIQAQKLLFGHTSAGDITGLFNGYFDTTIGGKTEVSSYEKIADHLNLAAQDILFLSDMPKELLAARKAGWQIFGLDRKQSKPFADDILCGASFADIPLQEVVL